MQRKNLIPFRSASVGGILLGTLAICATAESAEIPHTITRAPTALTEQPIDTPPEPVGPSVNTSTGAIGESVSENTSINANVSETAQPGVAGKISVNYFALLFGPGIQNSTSYQPTIHGQPDLANPILIKNYLGAGYNISNDIAVTPTAYWAYRPVQGQSMTLQDPYLMVSDAALYHSELGTNWYGDVRFHFPVTAASQAAQLRAGVQTFHYVSQELQGTRVTFGMSSSLRGNFYGRQGYGTDVELYAAPNVSYQITPLLSGLVRYELNGSHNYGDSFTHFNNDGTDIEPGVIWNVTNNLMINPYLNFTTGGSISLSSTSIGAYLNWTMI